MEKINLSSVFRISAATDGVPDVKSSEMSSLLGIGAFITNKSKTRLVVTFQFHTTQTLDFVESSAAQMVDQEYKLLIELFSNLNIDDKIFFPLDATTNDNLMISKKSTYFDNYHKKITLPAHPRIGLGIQAMDNAISRTVPASEKNRRLYRHVQMRNHKGSLPLKRFTLFSKLPAELRVKIWQMSFVGRTIVVDEDPRTIEGAVDFSKNRVITSNPIQLLINRESRAEVKRHYIFQKNHQATLAVQTLGKYKSRYLTNRFHPENTFLPSFGIYYHPRIDALSILTSSVYNNAILWCLPICGYELYRFRYMQTIVIREARLSAGDIGSFNDYRRGRLTFSFWGDTRFCQIREILIYPGKSVRFTEDNLLCTELGRKQSLEFLNEIFKEVYQLEEKAEGSLQAPRITIYLEDP
ncbi:uncharacterized protein EAF02_003298 [Botrytis sinoallii]|uniref:uncharacterized protein n=1 Tax=Botrytis sinoallii TaxID=1463999 RepID=UPI0018FF263E|nr:uncharacterized protein EAF02_003298 [Botrytis sinoallii]KAF7886651.1 hypothetical protein EAF02_003298 [Botrytis sinoallii]